MAWAVALSAGMPYQRENAVRVSPGSSLAGGIECESHGLGIGGCGNRGDGGSGFVERGGGFRRNGAIERGDRVGLDERRRC